MTLPFAHRLRVILVAFLQISTVVSLLLASQASAGTLDPAFGAGGKVTVAFPSGIQTFYDSYGSYVFVQPSGRIVGIGAIYQQSISGTTASGIAMAGLTPSGALDVAFADSGRTSQLFNSTFSFLLDIKMLPNGSMLRLAQHQNVNLNQPELRFINADGFLTASFSSQLFVNESATSVRKLAALPDGRILVLVKTNQPSDRHFLIRLKPDGVRDTTFGTGGVKEVPRISPLPNSAFIDMHTLANGKILIAGMSGYSSSTNDYDELFLLRLDSNGDADHSFGLLGLVRKEFGEQRIYGQDLIVQPDNKYLIAGSIKNPDENALMVRFTQRGKTDSAFGNAGVVITNFAVGVSDAIRSAKLSADGKIIAAGYAGIAGIPSETVTDFLVARYSSDGSLEAHTRTAFTPGQNSVATDAAIQPDGKIVVIGYTRNPNGVNGNVFAFARYTSITND